MSRVLLAGLSIAGFVWATIHIRYWNLVHPARLPFTTWSSVFVRRDVDERLRVSVIRAFAHNHIAVLRVRMREAKCELVCLAARVHEIAHTERRWQQCREALCVFADQLVQIARV